MIRRAIVEAAGIEVLCPDRNGACRWHGHCAQSIDTYRCWLLAVDQSYFLLTSGDRSTTIDHCPQDAIVFAWIVRVIQLQAIVPQREVTSVGATAWKNELDPGG